MSGGKAKRSRCNAVRYSLTAETLIAAREDAEDYEAFEAALTAETMSAIGRPVQIY